MGAVTDAPGQSPANGQVIVRELPLSRKRGSSKTPLSAALAKAVHWRFHLEAEHARNCASRYAEKLTPRIIAGGASS